MFTLSDFDYHLPLELIAQKPARPRDHSRLLLLNKKNGAINHKHFYNLIDYLKQGDLLVLNNSKVFPARLIGHKKITGGKIEIFLHHDLGLGKWECLIDGRVRDELIVEFSHKLKAQILKKNNDGTFLVKFNFQGPDFFKIVNKIGLMPLPPYIVRSNKLTSDKKNYQTVYAFDSKVGSVAAPTAGLHFTKMMLKKIKAKGVIIKYVTLHVGLGTFSPVRTEKITDHKMHSEFASIEAATVKEIIKTKKAGGRVIAVGTTSCRTLESIDWAKLRNSDQIRKQAFWTDIFIYPGYKFKIVDALVTNFHLPKSTLLMLVSALSSQKYINFAYREAVREKYRFFSYGDAMFIY